MIKSYLYKAIEASVNAGAIIMDIYENKIVEVETKADNSPVTIADQKANDYIEKALQSTEIPVISEEGEHSMYKIRKNWNQCWIVDPLDGTKELIKRNGEFTVNIALVENGKPILGVIYIPVQKALYYAIAEEQKAFKIELTEHKISEALLKDAVEIFPTSESETITITSSRSHANEQVVELIAKLEGEQKQIELEVERDILNALDIYENRLNIYAIQGQNVITNENNFERSKEQFQLGRITSIEFRQAQINLLNAQTNKNLAKYDAKLAELQLLQLTGQLLNVEL